MAVLINGTNIQTAYGAIIAEGGYNGLVEWPASKSIDSNNWHEYDGIEADLSELKLDSHSFSIKFGLKYSSPDQIETFYRFLGSTPKMTFSDDVAGIEKQLRLESLSSLKYAKSFSILTVKLSCDNDPLEGYSRVAPVSGLCPTDNDFKLDGTPFSDYGVRVLLGTHEGILKPGAVKQSLVRSMATSSGSEYDQNPLLWDGSKWVRSESVDTVRYGAYQVTVNCGIVAPNTSTFWRNYKALLYDLIHEDSTAADALTKCRRELYIGAIGKSLKCYYKSQSVKEFRILSGNRVWAKFNITLEVTE